MGKDTEADRGSVAADVVGSIALTIYSVTASVSFAALVFTGPAADGLARGAATFLLASGVVTVVLGIRTKFPLVFGVVQDTAAIVLAPAVAVVVANGSDDPVRDVFVVISMATLVTGIAMWAIGRARFATAARFMPTTVVAGFLAGTGWLLTKGGIDVMTNRNLGLGDLDALFGPELMKLWLPGAALGVVIALVPFVRRVPAIAASLATLVFTIGFFVAVLTTSTLAAVDAGGWLLGPFPEGAVIAPITGDLADADWSALAGTGGQVGVVLILSLLGVLLNISGIQAVLGQRVDADAELRSAGLANLLVVPFGGLVAYHGLGDSALAQQLGVRRRWAPIAVGIATAMMAFLGGGVLGYLPRLTAGGLLIGAGLGLLISWVGELRATPSRMDRAVSIVILATICFVGILEGIVVGMVAACIFFVVRYSRIDAVRVESTGRDRRSVVERSPTQNERLDDRGDRLAIYELHGSLFFGSVSGVASRIRDRLARTSAPIDVVIVDFARVTDIDSSAFAVLAELADDTCATGAALLWSGLDPSASAVLARAERADHASTFDDLDAALEYAEDLLLSQDDDPCVDEASPPPYSDELLSWFGARRVAAGDAILHEGDDSDELLVVVDGSVHVSRTDASGRMVRLRTLRPGAIIGEIGFLTGEARTATVTAETAVGLRVLTREQHVTLRREQPAVVIELYDHVLRSTAGRAAAIHRSLTQALR